MPSVPGCACVQSMLHPCRESPEPTLSRTQLKWTHRCSTGAKLPEVRLL